VRRMLTALAAGTVLMPLAACTSEPGPGPAAAGQSPSAASPSAASPSAASPPAASSPAASSSAGGSAAATPSTRPPPATTAAPPPGADELPGELPHGDRKLTGVVERSGDCAMLRVGDHLWGLTGGAVRPLRPGDRVTVQGQITTAAGGCAEAGATRSVVVRTVTRS
jgi:hypothetical protein